MKTTARLLIALLLVTGVPFARASETDNLTYRFLPLEDSAPKLNGLLDAFLERIAEETNAKLLATHHDARRATDTEVELTFVTTYRARSLRRFGDRLLTMFEGCIERNDCPGWPSFERIAVLRRESIYGEARYNTVAVSFIASTIDLCGVRLGTDKLTHLLSNGFLYYNASRRDGSPLTSQAEVYRMAMADERGLMGARSTSVVSPADAEATLAGFRLASDYFMGDDPVFSRDDATGLLVKRRRIDLCRYVTEKLDEVRNPPTYTACRRRVERLRAVIAERLAWNQRAEASTSAEEKERLRRELVARPLEKGHERLPFPYKLIVPFRYAVAYLTVPSESRRATRWVVFPKFDLEGRRPIVLRRERPLP
jgi:hypothetical protein